MKRKRENRRNQELRKEDTTEIYIILTPSFFYITSEIDRINKLLVMMIKWMIKWLTMLDVMWSCSESLVVPRVVDLQCHGDRLLQVAHNL